MDEPIPLQYRALLPGEQLAVVDLYRRVFEVDYDEAQWRWQYADNPRADLEEVFTCWARSRLAGHTASVPLDYIMDGEVVRASHIQNICVDPSFRRRGIFSRILDEIVAHHDAHGTPLLTGHPNANSYPLMMRTGHYEHLFDLYPWSVDLAPLAGATPDPAIEIADEVRFTEEDVACIRRELSAHTVYNARGRSYLDWRFGPASGRGYRVVRARAGGALVGIAVAKPYLAGSSLDLVEWIAPPDDDLLRSMLVGAAAAFSSMELRSASVFSMEHLPLHEPIRRLGFGRDERPTPFIARGKDSGPWRRPDAWYLSMADSDVY